MSFLSNLGSSIARFFTGGASRSAKQAPTSRNQAVTGLATRALAGHSAAAMTPSHTIHATAIARAAEAPLLRETHVVKSALADSRITDIKAHVLERINEKISAIKQNLKGAEKGGEKHTSELEKGRKWLLMRKAVEGFGVGEKSSADHVRGSLAISQFFRDEALHLSQLESAGRKRQVAPTVLSTLASRKEEHQRLSEIWSSFIHH